MLRLRALALSVLFAACSLGSDASDGSSPLVSIDFPASNSVVSGQVAIAVTAIDDFGVDQVRILIDDVERIKQFTAPFGYLWNTAQLPDNSTHVIKVEARDQAGNTGIKSITVTVQNGPQ